jgi:hypothetical protein
MDLIALLAILGLTVHYCLCQVIEPDLGEVKEFATTVVKFKKPIISVTEVDSTVITVAVITIKVVSSFEAN